MASQNIHATAILLSGRGVLLRGRSGAGKSLLALLLIEAWAGRGEEAMLIADDRVDIAADERGVILSPPAALAGLIELRGRGIVQRPHRDRARLSLVVDLVPDLERMPEEHHFMTELMGHAFARCPVPELGVVGADHQRLLIAEALAAIAIPVTGDNLSLAT